MLAMVAPTASGQQAGDRIRTHRGGGHVFTPSVEAVS
jgi:hypothetical protein